MLIKSSIQQILKLNSLLLNMLLLYLLLLAPLSTQASTNKENPFNNKIQVNIEKILTLRANINNFSYSELGKRDSLFNEIYQLSQENLPDSIKISADVLWGMHCFEKSKFIQARKAFESVLERANPTKDWELMAKAHNYLSLISEFEGKYIDVYAHNKKLICIGDKYDKIWNATAYLNLGAVNALLNDFETAESLYVTGIKLFEKIPEKVEYGWLLHRLGEQKMQSNKLLEAKPILKKAINFWEKIKNHRGLVYTKLLLGRTEGELGHPEIARKIFNSVLAACQTHKLWQCQINVLIVMGRHEYYQKNYKKAIHHIEQSINLSKAKSIPYNSKEGFEYLTKAYEASEPKIGGDQTYQVFLNGLQNSLKNNEDITKEWVNSMEVLSVQKKAFDLLKKNEKLGREKLELQQKINLFAFSFIIFLAFLAFRYALTNKKISKQKEALNDLNLKIQAQSDLLKKANEHIKEKKNNLQLELVKKLLSLNKQVDTLQQVDMHLQNLEKNKDTLAIKKLINHAKNDTIGEELNLQITKANSIFFEKLTKKFQHLSQGDLRLCALLKLNLRTKEIANLTFKNPQSVKVARSRLRKKLGLTHSNLDISVFLNQI